MASVVRMVSCPSRAAARSRAIVTGQPRLRSIPRRLRQQLLCGGSGHGYHEVETIKKWCGDAPPVARTRHHRTGARPLVDPFTTGARIHGRDQEKRGGKLHGSAGGSSTRITPSSKVGAAIQEPGDWKLSELVEEEHPMGCQARLARTRGPAPAADERNDRGLVMGRSERRPFEQRTLREQRAGRRVNPRQRHRFVLGEPRQKSRQTLGQHRLARNQVARSAASDGDPQRQLRGHGDPLADRECPRRPDRAPGPPRWRCQGSLATGPVASRQTPTAPMWRRHGRRTL